LPVALGFVDGKERTILNGIKRKTSGPQICRLGKKKKITPNVAICMTLSDI